MLHRNITAPLLAALADTPVVLVHGARQTGKTTLVRSLPDRGFHARYVTFDDTAVLAAAESDTESFLAQIGEPVIIDEVQRLPRLALAIKASVDRDRRPGRFLLTGSANVLHLPKLADSLAGRMEIQTLWPLSQGELAGVKDDIVAVLFGDTSPAGLSFRERSSVPLVERLCVGGYPEVQSRKSAERRHAWFSAYITTLLQRDVRDLAQIEGLTALPRLLALLASRTGSLLNYSDLARSIQIPQTTLKRYLALLEATFLVQPLPAWSSDLGLRLAKSAKLYLSDTGLLVDLLQVDPDRLRAAATQFGHVLENFVVAEIRKQLTWSSVRAQLFHYRTQNGHEVDLLLEGPAGRIVGIEVKSSASVNSGDFGGLRHLAETLGDRFHRGVVLYSGAEALPFGSSLVALPIQALWTVGAEVDAGRG